MDDPVRGHDVAGADIEAAAGSCRYRTSGPGNDQRTGGNVPRGKSIFPVPIDPARRNVTEVQRRRAKLTYCLDMRQDFAPDAGLDRAPGQMG